MQLNYQVRQSALFYLGLACNLELHTRQKYARI
jgi:hypothetical protein